MTEPETPQAEPDDLDRRHKEMRLELWEARQRAELEVYTADQHALDVEQPTTARQRLAYARELARSGLVPAGFRGGAKPQDVLNERQERVAAASIVLAQEWGTQLGFSGLAALQHLQVVEGNLGVKPKSARGMIQAAGHDLTDECAYSPAGFPVAWTVTIRRLTNGTLGPPKSVTFRLEQALRGKLISKILRDEAGNIVGVEARSERGNPLPWELYTEDMLQNRATGRLANLYASDVTGGMDITADWPEPPARPGGAEPTTVVAERLASVEPEPDPDGDDYDPGPDLDLIAQATGKSPPPWWEHADAPARLGVKRRSKVQLAADRLSEWVQRAPEEDTAEWMPPGLRREDGQWCLYVTPAEDVVDAEIEEDPPVAAPYRTLPARGVPGLTDVPLPEPTLDEALAAEHAAGWAADMDEPEPERPVPTRDDLLAVVAVLAEKAGKSVGQYTTRGAVLYRKVAQDWTVEELAEFIASQAPGLDVAELVGAR